MFFNRKQVNQHIRIHARYPGFGWPIEAEGQDEPSDVVVLEVVDLAVEVVDVYENGEEEEEEIEVEVEKAEKVEEVEDMEVEVEKVDTGHFLHLSIVTRFSNLRDPPKGNSGTVHLRGAPV